MVALNNPSTPSIQELLVGVSFPVSKAQLLDHLRMNGAAEWMLEPVANASTERFSSPQEVMDTIRGS